MADGEARPDDVVREAITMVLYVSIVLLATLAALPVGSDETGHASGGVHQVRLVGLLWGEALGLALAHWFAFRLTARDLGAGRLTNTEARIGAVQVAAAGLVAAMCTVPVLLVDDASEVQVTMLVPTGIIGFAGCRAALGSGRTRLRSLLVGGLYVVFGLAVALMKNVLAGH